jgi:hypothetical protein
VPRSDIPAVTHVDYSARVQTVHQHTNPRFHSLIGRFKALTGCPVIVNTSFNVRGEPIVCTPTDAYRCFMGTNLDGERTSTHWQSATAFFARATSRQSFGPAATPARSSSTDRSSARFGHVRDAATS